MSAVSLGALDSVMYWFRVKPEFWTEPGLGSLWSMRTCLQVPHHGAWEPGRPGQGHELVQGEA